MIDARQIYEDIKNYAMLDGKVFCDLHKCDDHDKCNHKQHHNMLNFDEVKNIYCRSKKINSCKSVDGLSYNNNGILFVIEIKGWELYNKHENPQSKQEVINKVEGYELPKKLLHSLMICKDILAKKGTIIVPMVYLVVSDIKNEGIESIDSNLSLLAETSSSLSNIYGNEIRSQLSGISDIDVGFVENCQQIDNELNSWEKARNVRLL